MTERLLVLAPHPDDEVLGAGGTIAKCSAAGGQVMVITVCVHGPPIHSAEHRDRTLREAAAAHRVLGVTESCFLQHPILTPLTGEIHHRCSREMERFRPTVMLIPHPDLHPDHRAVFDLGMYLGRPLGAGRELRALACYETITETHWNAPHLQPTFMPTWFVDVETSLATKLEAARCYESQMYPHPEPRSLEVLRALARFRGSHIGATDAEAFQVIRMKGSLDR